MKKQPKVHNVIPNQTGILFEILENDEIYSENESSIILPDNQKAKANADNPPQVRVLALGNQIKPENTGINVNSRLIITGNYTPIPLSYMPGKRKKGICDFSAVKAILEEVAEE